ncbi:MAG: transaldolase [Lachnospiraceae bacterium]|nr:transaldolase [Lachnospiraceae bacterium]MBQ7261603.1 transaldolase [Lachnospiraceae bacterium]HAV00865.1 transaldolase [Lachnospiraceae bacterium]
MRFEDLRVTVYADGADIEGMKEEYRKGFVKGFTTNPTLMKKAGVKDYISFAKEALKEIPDLPLSLEVFADDFDTMEKEARVISALSENVFVKIPITNSKGESSIPLIKKLSEDGIRLNVTAMLTIPQVKDAVAAFKDGTENIVSVFAGRILDTGVDAVPVMKEVAQICKTKPGTLSLWASCREVYNIIQADQCGTDIITVTNDILKKLPNLGKDLTKLSLETVQMFVNDGKSLGFSILS